MIEITEKENKLLKEIAQNYSIELFLLFGSRVSNRVHRESDYDVAYFGKKNLDLIEEARLIVDLAPVFKSENIDLVNLKKAKPLLFYAIFRQSQVLYAKDNLLFPTLRVYAFKKYIETKPLYEEKFRRIQNKLKV